MAKEGTAAKPFLKWVGGKRSIINLLLDRVPEKFTDYYEPFLGGGALFFTLQPHRAHLSDINSRLITTFKVVRDHPDDLIELLKIHTHKHSKTYYLKARKQLAAETDPIKVAAWFIYLNKTCFNGLYRVNKSGQFNVPLGRYKKPAILDEDNLRNASKALKGVEIKQHNYRSLKPKKDQFFYLDPPYHQTYSQYSNDGFGEREHKELADFTKLIDSNKAYFMLSNADTPLIRRLYSGYNIEVVSASRSVSSKASQRGKENELLIRNYG